MASAAPVSAMRNSSGFHRLNHSSPARLRRLVLMHLATLTNALTAHLISFGCEERMFSPVRSTQEDLMNVRGQGAVTELMMMNGCP